MSAGGFRLGAPFRSAVADARRVGRTMTSWTGDATGEGPMNDLATARADFLEKVEGYASGQAARFAPALDELIRWSRENGLEFTHHAGVHDLVKFSVPGAGMAFWSATPRTGDGAKLTLLNDRRFPEPLRAAARDELARIDGKEARPDGVPEVAFTKLIWEPYRVRLLGLMGRLLDGLGRPAPDSGPATGAVEPQPPGR
jgi:hypothetical protein